MKSFDEMFDKLLKSFDLNEYIIKILTDNDLRINILKNSYSHANGFTKITLYNNNSYKLRLHIWDNYNLVYREDIHTHKWDFASKILFGSYSYENYKISEDDIGISYLEYEYVPKIEPNTYGIYFKGDKKLQLIDNGIKNKGDVIFQSFNMPHRVSTNNFTATLFLTSPPKRKTSFIFTKEKINSNINPYNYMTEVDLRNKLKKFSIHYA